MTRGLSAVLIGPPVGTTSPDQLQQQDTSALNRTRVDENRRAMAAQILAFSVPMVLSCGILMVGMIVAILYVYVRGWVVFMRHTDQECDQPMKWWLFAVLFVPVLKFEPLLRAVRSEEERPKASPLNTLMLNLLVGSGWYMLLAAKTCQKTNQELYGYVQLWLYFELASNLLAVVMSCGLVSFVFFLHRRGLLTSEPGPMSAGRPGLIKDLETVEYSEELFSESRQDNREPPECSICVQTFTEETVIKKTPCGHFFCEPCLGEWLEHYGKTCPLCRTDLEAAMDPEAAG